MDNYSAMWVYWANYDEPNLNEVLQKARQEVFERGEYYLGPKPELTWLGKPIDPNNPTDPGIPPEYLAWMHRIEAIRDRPNTIEQLLDWNEPSGEGTRSIIDILSISNTLRWGKSSCAVPDDLLSEWFGTTKPTRAYVEEKLDSMFYLTSRGTAVHIVVYEGTEPTQVVFVGNTVD